MAKLHPITWLNQPGYVGETLNPIRARDNRGKVGWHCEAFSPGCAHCYAEALNGRFGNQLFYTRDNRQHTTPFLDDATVVKPIHWKRPRCIFWGDMSDLFGEWVPDEWLDQMFAVMSMTHWHRHILLTKRPERARSYLTDNPLMRIARWEYLATHTFGRIDDGQLPALPLPGVWLGTTTESQATADKRIPALLGTPAAVRFLSCEPLLGEISLGRGLYSEHDLAGMDEQYLAPIGGNSTAKIDWVIAGGESGPEARPMHPQWAMSIRDQCEEAGTPYFFKQWGEWCPGEFGTQVPDCLGARVDDPRYFHYFDDPPYKTWRVGKKTAGCLLDGREHREFPEVPA